MSDRVAAPRESRGFEPKNRLLAALPSKDLLGLQRHLEAVPLERGSILLDVDQPLTHLYFVETGVAALLAVLEHRVIGVAAVGPEGVVDVHTLLLGGDTALGRCQILVPGSALAVQVAPFRNALRQSPTLHAACEAYTRALFVQMLQAVPCNRLHTAEQRCARWLLTCADRTEDDTFEVASEGLAQMLGIAQSTSTVIVRKLQNDRLIRYRRGVITVLDRQGLEAAACECYRLLRGRYERLAACDVG